MKHLLIFSVFLFFAFFSSAHSNSATIKSKPIDSNYFKNRGIYLTLSPLMVSYSFNTDTKEHLGVYSGRIGVNWTTKNYRKFQIFGAKGITSEVFDLEKTTTTEIGFMVGKLYKDKNSGFWDVNVGLAYIGSKTKTSVTSGSFWDGSYASSVKEIGTETFGIPFDATFYGSKLPFGVGVGIAGNLNLDRPYLGLLVRMRFGNPVRKKHSTSK